MIEERIRAFLAHPYEDAEGRSLYFVEDAVCADPVGIDPVVGRAAIRAKFQATIDMGIRSKVEVIRCIVAADKAAIAFTAEVFRDGALIRATEEMMFFEIYAADKRIARFDAFIGS